MEVGVGLNMHECLGVCVCMLSPSAVCVCTLINPACCLEGGISFFLLTPSAHFYVFFFLFLLLFRSDRAVSLRLPLSVTL